MAAAQKRPRRQRVPHENRNPPSLQRGGLKSVSAQRRSSLETKQRIPGMLKFERDDRMPIFVLKLPTVNMTRPISASLEFYAFDARFWLHSFSLLMFQALVNIVIAIVIYYGIVMQRRKHKGRGSFVSPYLVGYGFVIPVLLWLPCFLVEAFDLHNVAMILCVGGSNPAMLLFRCAMHDTMPGYLTKRGNEHPSLRQFVSYYASSIQFELDPDTGEPVMFDLRKHGPAKLLKFASVFLQTSLCYSLLLSFSYQIFPKHDMTSFMDLFRPGHVLNNYFMASLTSLALESGACGLGLMTSAVTRISTMEFSDSPLTKSTSPSDFWGKRWNQLVGPALRRGIYLPLRLRLNLHTHIAAALTFVASGFLHEYVLFVLSLRRGTPNTPFEGQETFVPNYGNHLRFFSWCAVTLVGERLLGGYFSPWLPSHGPLRTFLVLMTTLPFAHLFVDEYVACSFYSDISLGFPKILYKEN